MPPLGDRIEMHFGKESHFMIPYNLLQASSRRDDLIAQDDLFCSPDPASSMGIK